MANAKGTLAYLLFLALFAAAAWAILANPIARKSAETPSSPTREPETAAINPIPSKTHPSGISADLRDTFKRPFPILLCQLAAVVAAALLCGKLSRRLGQPSVIGEMAAGIILGPSLLGHFLPAVEGFLFPPASLANLNLLSQVGIILFMFSVGMEIDLGSLRKHAKVAVFVSHAGIVMPFLLGMIAALLLFRDYAPADVKFPAFALFMGIAMSITAFPVLARIIEERGLSSTSLGTTAMASAAVDDVTAWTLLALVIAVARAQSPFSALPIAAMALAFTLAMVFLMRPLAARWMARGLDPQGDPAGQGPGRGLASLVLICVFLSSVATEAIGIHSLFGAFLAGTIMPPAKAFRTFLRERLEYSASLFLLPVFFASTGLRARVDIMDQGGDWAVFAALMALAVAGKLGGVSLAARFTGASWRNAFALGALMNTRGLMELIVLNVGLDLGILSPRIFTMMVLVALATTAMTGPLLSMLKVGRGRSPGNRESDLIPRAL
ncbi:MAG: sodium:proton symporter [Fibrobacteres bacterium]|nr:sodium:proton symporter [Fibrobacterota bacterium]